MLSTPQAKHQTSPRPAAPWPGASLHPPSATSFLTHPALTASPTSGTLVTGRFPVTAAASPAAAAGADGAGTAPTVLTHEQALRGAYLEWRLAQAAEGGARWAELDLSGRPLEVAGGARVYQSR